VAELLVLAPLGPPAVREAFARGEIPLHVTVLPNVRISDEKVEGFSAAVAEIASATPPVAVSGDHIERFGRKGDVTVTVLTPVPGLDALHRRLLAAAVGAGAISVDPEYNGDGFCAHATHVPLGVFAPGENTVLSRIVLVERLQDLYRVLQVDDLAG
jgi:hypothetical protein